MDTRLGAQEEEVKGIAAGAERAKRKW
jgi:hypothetical protein